ncbi:acylsugar acyltransferase 3-like [Lycium barbarum]|uniref:acylsugar acyltransferase 3-like n=1 Tax=Lycium barbarum TaxID=112863 RepID=UPI00293E3DB8|nr:acylsugar acyltransferase 3-like [Lycium barbarum]
MASAKSQVVSISKKIIKPSTPIPSSLRRHNLSFMDQLVSPAHNPLAFFYPKRTNSSYDQNHISQLLENSFAEVLTSYYPFAGTIKDNVFIDCDDRGAEFYNVRVNSSMSKILSHPNYHDATKLAYPQGLPWNTSYDGSLVVAQLTHFDCGGIAISICISHKVADAYCVIKFINDWAALTRDLGAKPSTQFDGTSFFPPTSDPSTLPNFEPENQECVTRLYHYSSSALGRLKAIAFAESGVENPTRVEVATALVHRCAAAASAKRNNNSGSFKPSLLCHIMGLRPPVPLNYIGNASCFFVSSAPTEDDMQMPQLVAQLRKAKHQLRDKLKNVPQNELFSQTLEVIKGGAELLAQLSNFDLYRCSSLCNFGLCILKECMYIKHSNLPLWQIIVPNNNTCRSFSKI